MPPRPLPPPVRVNAPSELAADGVVASTERYEGRVRRVDWALTPAGEDLLPVFHALMVWGDRHEPNGGGDPPESCRVAARARPKRQRTTFVVFGAIGFWMPLCRAKIPRATFLEQGTLDATRRIVANSDLPAFHTAVAASRAPAPEGRVVVPLRDPEATATYHFVCRADRADALAPVFDALPAP